MTNPITALLDAPVTEYAKVFNGYRKRASDIDLLLPRFAKRKGLTRDYDFADDLREAAARLDAHLDTLPQDTRAKLADSLFPTFVYYAGLFDELPDFFAAICEGRSKGALFSCGYYEMASFDL